MLAQTIDVQEELENYIKSNSKSSIRDSFMHGAFAVYKMVITAEDDQNKLREVMYKLGEQFRKEFK
jgi:predicted hydrocarbon binding protein